MTDIPYSIIITYNDCMPLAWMVMVVEQLKTMMVLMKLYVEAKLEKEIHFALVLDVPRLQTVLVTS